MSNQSTSISPIIKIDPGDIVLRKLHSTGHGPHTDVYEAVWTSKQMKVAVKVFRKGHMEQELMMKKGQMKTAKQVYEDKLDREYGTWANLPDHKNVLKVLGVCAHPGLASSGLVSRWMDGGDIASYLRDNPGANKLEILKDIARGLAHLHSWKVVHGDIAMRNILIDVYKDRAVAVIADFGRSRFLEQPNYISSTISTHTTRYSLPEALLADDAKQTTRSLTKEGDVYSFSMVMLEILTDKIPLFKVYSDFKAATAISRNTRPKRDDYEAPAFQPSEQYWKVMEKCWKQEPSERPTIDEVAVELGSIRL